MKKGCGAVTAVLKHPSVVKGRPVPSSMCSHLFIYFFYILIKSFYLFIIWILNIICRACNWCGKVLADETGTADEYNQLFLRLQALQDLGSVSNQRRRRIKKQ